MSSTLEQLVTPAWSPIWEYRDGRQQYGPTGERADFIRDWDDETFSIGFLRAGRRSTKTLRVMRGMAERTMNSSGQRRFIAMPTRDQVKRAYWENVKKLFPDHLIRRVYEVDLCIRTVGDSELWLFGLDKPERVEGDVAGWHDAAVDEYADVKPGAVDAHILPTLAQNDGTLLLLGVPDVDGRNADEYEEKWGRCLTGDERRAATDESRATGRKVEYVGYKWSSRDILSPEAITLLLSTMRADIAEQELGAETIKPHGLAYPMAAPETRTDAIEYDPNRPILVGADFNVTFHRWIVAQDCPTGDPLTPYGIRVLDEVALEDADAATMAMALRSLLGRSHFAPRDKFNKPWSESTMVHFYGDIAGNTRWAQATYTAWDQVRAAFPYARQLWRASRSVADRVNGVNQFLCDGRGFRRLFIHTRCVNLWEDFSKITRKMLHQEKHLSGRLTHASDALGYLIEQHRFMG